MGTMQHDALLITGDGPNVRWCHVQASKIFPPFLVSELSEPLGNMECVSFCIWPDGGKEGFQASDHVNELRKRFVEFLETMPVNYVHVSFGELGLHIGKGTYKSPTERW